jgi:hypothetical protein
MEKIPEVSPVFHAARHENSNACGFLTTFHMHFAMSGSFEFRDFGIYYFQQDESKVAT